MFKKKKPHFVKKKEKENSTLSKALDIVLILRHFFKVIFRPKNHRFYINISKQDYCPYMNNSIFCQKNNTSLLQLTLP